MFSGRVIHGSMSLRQLRTQESEMHWIVRPTSSVIRVTDCICKYCKISAIQDPPGRNANTTGWNLYWKGVCQAIGISTRTTPIAVCLATIPVYQVQMKLINQPDA